MEGVELPNWTITSLLGQLPDWRLLWRPLWWSSLKGGLGIVATFLVCNIMFVAVFVPGETDSFNQLNSEMDGIWVEVAGINEWAGPVLASFAQLDPLGSTLGFQVDPFKNCLLSCIHFLLDAKCNFIPGGFGV